MKHLDGLLNAVDNEFGAIEANGKFRNRDEIEYVYKLVDIAKDVYCIWQYEDEMDNGYSENYGGMAYRSYDDGYSNARGRGRGRDGRYTSRNDGYRDGSYRGRGGNSYRRGYSRDDGKEEYLQNLREMMNDAPDENTRQSIQRMITQMEGM